MVMLFADRTGTARTIRLREAPRRETLSVWSGAMVANRGRFPGVVATVIDSAGQRRFIQRTAVEAVTVLDQSRIAAFHADA
jgi:hypothetical protein